MPHGVPVDSSNIADLERRIKSIVIYPHTSFYAIVIFSSKCAANFINAVVIKCRYKDSVLQRLFLENAERPFCQNPSVGQSTPSSISSIGGESATSDCCICCISIAAQSARLRGCRFLIAFTSASLPIFSIKVCF